MITTVTRTKWIVAGLLCGGAVMDYLARMSLYSVLPLLRKDLVLSDVALGLVASSFPWIYGVLSPVAGYLGDRFSRRVVVSTSVVSLSAVSILTGLVTTAWQLVAMRGVLAVAEVCYVPTAQALIADFHSVETRAKASGLFQIGSYIGIFLAGMPAAYVATHYGWRVMLVACGALGMVFAVAMRRGLPRSVEPNSVTCTKPEEEISIRESLSLFRNSSFLLIMAAFTLISINFWVMFTYLPMFIYHGYHTSLESAAFQATFYMQISAMFLMPVFSSVSDVWSIRNVRNRFLACAFACLLGVPSLVAVGTGKHVSMLIGGLILAGLVMAATDSSWLPMLCAVSTQRHWATGYGLLNTAGTVAGGVAAMVTALMMKRFGLGTIIASLGALYVLMASALIIVGLVLLPHDAVSPETHTV